MKSKKNTIPVKDLFDFHNGDILYNSFTDGWKPPTRLTVTQWAEKYRYLPGESSNEPGFYRVTKTPFLKEIMDNLSENSKYTHVAFMKGSQIGASEAGINWIGYTISAAPAAMIYFLPTQKLVDTINEQKLDPMIRNCPTVEEKIIKNKGKEKADTKRFKGGRLFLKATGSAANLSAVSAKNLFLDEVDRMLANVGGEGDPVSLAETRASSFGVNKKIFIPSTPTVKDASIVEREFLAGDQRYFFVPCPHCGHEQILNWENLKYSVSEHKQITDVYYKCCKCKKPIDEQKHKTNMLAKGIWKATAEPTEVTRVSYHLSTLYSPYGWYSWKEMAAEYEKSKDDENKLVQFYNTKLGVTYELQGDSPPWRTIFDQAEDYPLQVVPKDCLFITAGVDTQPDRLEYEVVAWAKDKQSWSIDIGVIDGDPDVLEDDPKTGKESVWTRLERVLDTEYEHELGSKMNISVMAIDTGGHNTQAVYAWCLKMDNEIAYGHSGVNLSGVKNIMPIKGYDDWNSFVRVPNRIEVNGVKNALRLWAVGSSALKKDIYSALKVEKPTDGESFKPRTCHFPNTYDIEYFKQLTSEKQMIQNTKNGGFKRIWIKTPNVRNEALDIRVYARAAAHLVGLDDPSKNWKSLERRVTEKPTSVKIKSSKAQSVLKKYKKKHSIS